jgi:hypothetical protein
VHPESNSILLLWQWPKQYILTDQDCQPRFRRSIISPISTITKLMKTTLLISLIDEIRPAAKGPLSV